MRRTRLSSEQQTVLEAIGQTIADDPGSIAALLYQYQVQLPMLPSPQLLIDHVVALMLVDQSAFQDDLAQLLAASGRLKALPGDEDHFVTAILGAASAATGAISDMASSKQNRKAIEAESKAQITAARTHASSGFRSNIIALNAQTRQAQLMEKLSQNKGKVTVTLAGTALIGLLGFFGFRHWKRSQPITRLT